MTQPHILSSGAVISVERNLQQSLQMKGSGLLTNIVHEIDEFVMILLVGHYDEILVMKYH